MRLPASGSWRSDRPPWPGRPAQAATQPGGCLLKLISRVRPAWRSAVPRRSVRCGVVPRPPGVRAGKALVPACGAGFAPPRSGPGSVQRLGELRDHQCGYAGEPDPGPAPQSATRTFCCLGAAGRSMAPARSTVPGPASSRRPPARTVVISSGCLLCPFDLGGEVSSTAAMGAPGRAPGSTADPVRPSTVSPAAPQRDDRHIADRVAAQVGVASEAVLHDPAPGGAHESSPHGAASHPQVAGRRHPNSRRVSAGPAVVGDRDHGGELAGRGAASRTARRTGRTRRDRPLVSRPGGGAGGKPNRPPGASVSLCSPRLPCCHRPRSRCTTWTDQVPASRVAISRPSPRSVLARCSPHEQRELPRPARRLALPRPPPSTRRGTAQRPAGRERRSGPPGPGRSAGPAGRPSAGWAGTGSRRPCRRPSAART
jgi:hypothetical protein